MLSPEAMKIVQEELLKQVKLQSPGLTPCIRPASKAIEIPQHVLDMVRSMELPTKKEGE
jgi:hypothetical protein